MGTSILGNTSFEPLTTLYDERCDLGRWARKSNRKKERYGKVR